MKKTLFLIFLLIIISNNVLSINLSSNVILVKDIKNENILYEKNSNHLIYPASTTKILTAILAIENLNLDEQLTVSYNDLNNIPYNSSTMGLNIYSSLAVEEVLNGLLIVSGNDAAILLANRISGNIENFANLMNKKAKEIGCTHSNFVNPHGYHNIDHYSTVNDMIKIMEYAMKYDLIKDILKKENYKNINNTNLLLQTTNKYKIYGKTGYIPNSGKVFLGYSNLYNMDIIFGVYENIYNTKESTFSDLNKLGNYVFNDLKGYQEFKNISLMIIDENSNTKKIYYLKDNINLYKGKKLIDYNLDNKLNLDIKVKMNNFNFNYLNKFNIE